MSTHNTPINIYMLKIRIVNSSSDIELKVNGDIRPVNIVDDQIIIDEDPIDTVELSVKGTLTVNDIDYDDIRFGIVTFLCTTANGEKQTQVTDGIIKIELRHPIWEFWCQKMNEFNYEDYPLGSTD